MKYFLYIIFASITVLGASSFVGSPYSECSSSQIGQSDKVTSECDPDEINKMLNAELSEAERCDDKILAGFWFKPHEASSVNIFFHKDKSFQMWDYVVKKNTDIVNICRQGTYTLKRDSVILKCSDGKRLSLRWWKANSKSKDSNKYITKKANKKSSGYWLVKGGF